MQKPPSVFAIRSSRWLHVQDMRTVSLQQHDHGTPVVHMRAPEKLLQGGHSWHLLPRDGSHLCCQRAVLLHPHIGKPLLLLLYSTLRRGRGDSWSH